MDGRANVGRGRGRGRGIREVGTEGLARGRGRGRGRGARVERTDDAVKSNFASEEEANDEKEQVYLAHGFLNPAKITIPSLSDSIAPGDERYCMLYTMNNTKSIYLHLAENFARKVDNFIAATGRWYEKQIRDMKRLDLIVKNDQLRPGAIVVVYHKENGRKEWKRAKLLESFQTHQGICYKVLLLDLGDEVDVLPLDIYYLHGGFAKQPQFAIKAQLRFSSYYEGTYTENYGWGYKFCQRLLRSVLNEQILVRFIRKGLEDLDNDQCWEVTLLSMKNPPAELSIGRPIEQQIVAQLTGPYVDESG